MEQKLGQDSTQTTVKLWEQDSECGVGACIRKPAEYVRCSRLVEDVALLEICPMDVKEQMMTRLGEIGENYEHLKAKVVPYTTNKTEQARGGQRMYVLMEGDHVSGSEADEEDWETEDERHVTVG